MPVMDALQTDNLVTWLETEALKLGTENQRQRWMDDLLPEDELTQLARAELFQRFDGFTRWSGRDRPKIGAKIRHADPCRHHPDADAASIAVDTTAATDLDHDEYELLKTVRDHAMVMQMHPWLEASGGKVTVTAMTHWAECRRCGTEACRSSVKVDVEWAGRILTREYAL